jgi:ADP-dependent NAD(P)H-hydrate dehydratase / NAD(P)H-hydrate epimerase
MRSADTRMITAAEMAEIDRLTSERHGIPPEILMENAGQNAWRELARRVFPATPPGAWSAASATDPRSIVFVAGRGNNGGDALVMARHALVDQRATVRIITLTRDMGDLAARQWAILEGMGATRTVWQEDPERCGEVLDGAEWIVDGITGTGLRSPLRPEAAALVDRINGAPGRRLCVDLPSGLREGGDPDEPAVHGDVTIVTGYLKTLLYEAANRGRAGEISRVEPGFPPELLEDAAIVTSRVRLMEPVSRHPAALRPEMHKGDRGRVIVLGGSSGAAGAAILAATAAAAAGAGMVRLLGSGDAVAASLAREPAIMAAMLPAAVDAEEDIEWADCAVLGPGWLSLTDPELEKWIDRCDRATTAMVIDATALRVLAEKGGAWRRLGTTQVPVVLTPHLGEWRGLTGDDGSIQWLRRAELPENVTVVVKSAVTAVRWGDGAVDVLDGRTAALATAGSGDVLSGLLGGAIARLAAPPQGLSQAVRWALTSHLDAGRRAEAAGRVVTASELVGEIAAASSREYR